MKEKIKELIKMDNINLDDFYSISITPYRIALQGDYNKDIICKYAKLCDNHFSKINDYRGVINMKDYEIRIIFVK